MAKRERKNDHLPPRRLRMNRPRRLQAAPAFLASFTGKYVVRGYARWFGVDLACALVELRSLGIELDPVYVEQLRMNEREKARLGRERNERERLAKPAAREDLLEPEQPGWWENAAGAAIGPRDEDCPF